MTLFVHEALEKWERTAGLQERTEKELASSVLLPKEGINMHRNVKSLLKKKKKNQWMTHPVAAHSTLI